MTDYEYGRNIQMVMAAQWKTFFADLDGERQGQQVAVEIDGELTLASPDPATVPLLGIEYEHQHKHGSVTVTTGTRETSKTYTVESPSLVWAVHDTQGEMMAVEIIGRDGRNLILRFSTHPNI